MSVFVVCTRLYYNCFGSQFIFYPLKQGPYLKSEDNLKVDSQVKIRIRFWIGHTAVIVKINIRDPGMH